MRTLHVIGGLMLIVSVGLIEGGTPLMLGALVGFMGGALMLATMSRTGWYL